jgi:hypothetical protein
LMLDERLAAFRRCGMELPAPIVVADRGLSDSKLMQPVHDTHQGTVLVEGKQSHPFTLPDGHKVTGQDVIHSAGWRWRQHPWEGGVRYGSGPPVPPMAR